MKKTSTKILAIIFTIICIATTFTVYSTAASYSLFDWQYTSVTNTTGKSSAYYSGLYIGSSNDYYSFNAYCQGGTYTSFKTTLYMTISGISTKNLDSDTTGSRTLEYTIYGDADEIIGSANGYTEQRCESKSNSSDYWRYNYLRVWVGGTTGWRTY